MSFVFVLKPGKGTPRGQCLFTLVMGDLCYIETYLQSKLWNVTVYNSSSFVQEAILNKVRLQCSFQ